MAQAKYRKKPRLNGNTAAVSRNGRRGTASAVQGGDSDSDLSDVLPASHTGLGASPYEALVGALDVPASRARQTGSSARHKKAKLCIETVTEHWRQQRATQETAEAGTTSTSQNDFTHHHDNGGIASAEHTLAAEQQTDQPATDHFNQHFQQTAAEQTSPPQGVATAEAGTAVPGMCKSEWPDAEWLNTGQPFPKVHTSLQSYAVRPRLQALWRGAHGTAVSSDGPVPQSNKARKRQRKAQQAEAEADVNAEEAAPDTLASKHMPSMPEQHANFVSPQQSAVFAICNSYKDLFLPNYPYPTSSDEADPILDACLLHCTSHITKTAELIKKNNLKVKADPDAEVPRDQGYTRPKVLILLPMRNMAYKLILRLLQLTQKETRADSILGKQRFVDDFGPGEEDSEDEGMTDRAKKVKAEMPLDHQQLFEGNCDDHFQIGLKITRGSVRLYADFYESDIIVASPLALATKLTEGEEEDGGAADMLSSIEVLLVARLDVLQMQNWAHMTTVLEALNEVPKGQHGVDIMRVREWYLSGQARQFRQTILLSSFGSAEANALFNRSCSNHAGKVRLKVAHKGVLSHVINSVRQLYERIPGSEAAADADTRYDHFTKRVWPRIKESGSSGQMIFVRSYFDFVRLRNFLKEEGASFVGLCEYTRHSDVSRGRSNFFHGRRRIMLYTERAHFYHRYRLRGVKDVLFYQLPEHQTFYSELVACCTEGSLAAGGHGHATVTVLFSKFDVLQMQRVVGNARHAKMLKSESSTFLYC